MDTINITKQLVGLPSYLGRKGGGEKPVAEYLEKFIKKNLPYFSIYRQKVAKGRYNIIARDNAATKAKLIFCGHMDTVPAKKKQLDKNNNLKVKKTAGKIIGLGSVDMKGGIAALLATLAGLRRPTKGLTLVFYCDEEYDFLGMKKIIKEENFKAELAVFCEPTDLKISNGCRGLIEFSGYVRGKTAHASRPDNGVNAIIGASRAFKRFQTRIRQYKNSGLGKSVCNLAGIDGGLETKDAFGNLNIQYSGNNVPDIAFVVIEVRTSDKKLDAVRAIKFFKQAAEDEKCNFVLAGRKHNYRSFYTKKKDLKKVEAALRESGVSVKYSDMSKQGYYDAEMFSRRFSLPCISVGPGPVTKSHAEDEYADAQSLKKTQEIYYNIMRAYGVV